MEPVRSPTAGERARVWPVFALVPAALVVAMIASSACAALALEGSGLAFDAEGLRQLSASALGVSAVLVPAQFVFLAAAVGAALRSPGGLRGRLALRAPGASAAACALLVLGTLGVQGLIQIASPLLGEPSQRLRDLSGLLSNAHGADQVLVVLIAGLVPGLCEELLYRGFAQTRLAERWGPARAILVSAVLFALSHLDPQQSAGVLPLGAWFGVVAWLTGSTWVAVAAHAVNNHFAAIHLQGAPPGAVFDPPSDPWALAGIAAACAAGLLGVVLARRRTSPTAGAPPA